ncbi:unnamed protein product [Symbiodinium natans]|uniref:Fe2OG dioxygenase domain-containing protein n=1 Tax=Symbiodinium natans TaxID=878477 RepID=A0A812I0N7_9DINO|nr:unnamed protein product [Symbiodinium natans]
MSDSAPLNPAGIPIPEDGASSLSMSFDGNAPGDEAPPRDSEPPLTTNALRIHDMRLFQRGAVSEAAAPTGAPSSLSTTTPWQVVSPHERQASAPNVAERGSLQTFNPTAPSFSMPNSATMNSLMIGEQRLMQNQANVSQTFIQNDRSPLIEQIAEHRHNQILGQITNSFQEQMLSMGSHVMSGVSKLRVELAQAETRLGEEEQQARARFSTGQTQLESQALEINMARGEAHALAEKLRSAESHADLSYARLQEQLHLAEAKAMSNADLMNSELDSVRVSAAQATNAVQASSEVEINRLSAEVRDFRVVVSQESEKRKAAERENAELKLQLSKAIAALEAHANASSSVPTVPPGLVPTIPINTPPQDGMGPRFRRPPDGGGPDDGDDGGSDDDDSRLSPKQLKALLKSLARSSKKSGDDKDTEDEGSKNKSKEAEKIVFPKFPTPEQQILFLLHKYFATNALHNSVYDMEDLLSVTMTNENLVTFIRRPSGACHASTPEGAIRAPSHTHTRQRPWSAQSLEVAVTVETNAPSCIRESQVLRLRPEDSKGSKNSKGSNGSRKSGGSGRKKGGGHSIPTAVCLLGAMMAGTAHHADAYTLRKDESCWPSHYSEFTHLALAAVSFDDSPDYINFPLRDGELKYSVEYPKRTFTSSWSTEDVPSGNAQSTRDALMAARMLRASVRSSLDGVPAKCNFCCDTEFGCDHCIPKGLRVTCPAKPDAALCSHPMEWIGDTGSAQDLISERELADLVPFESDCPINISTANGPGYANRNCVPCKKDRRIIRSRRSAIRVKDDRDSKYLVFGAFSHGGMQGITKRSKSYPKVIQYLLGYLRKHGVDGPVTSLAVNCNSDVKMHKDVNNHRDHDNFTISLGDFTGGQLWVHDNCIEKNQRDTEVMTSPSGDSMVGKLWDSRENVVTFNPKSYHCVTPWKGERWSITAYVNRAIHKLSPDEITKLKEYGFLVPRRSVEVPAAPVEIDEEMTLHDLAMMDLPKSSPDREEASYLLNRAIRLLILKDECIAALQHFVSSSDEAYQFHVPNGEFVFPMRERYEKVQQGLATDALEGPVSQSLTNQDAEPALEQDSVDADRKDEPSLVIDPKSGKMIPIPEGGGYYDSGGTLGRRYGGTRGSRKPDSIPSDLWVRLSKKQKDKAIEDEVRENALRELESGGGGSSGSSGKPAAVANASKDEWVIRGDKLIRFHYIPRKELFSPDLTDCPVPIASLGRDRVTKIMPLGGTEIIPDADEWRNVRRRNKKLSYKWIGRTEFSVIARPDSSGQATVGSQDFPCMPTVPTAEDPHRTKVARAFPETFQEITEAIAMVARPVGKKELMTDSDAQASLDMEWDKLIKKKAWDMSTVREWDDVSKEAAKKGKKAHVGKIFEICVEKGSELPKGNPLRKFKGRTVFQGNNVRDENNDTALFSELGSSPATMEAGKVLDAYGHAPNHGVEQADGKQAYTQTTLKGADTWVRLPRERWPKEWIGKYKDPVVRLRLALYGHPDSGGFWEQHCEKRLKEVGFELVYPAAWPSVFFHPTLRLLLAVYVDDFKMAGPKENLAKGWELIGSRIDMVPFKPRAAEALALDLGSHRLTVAAPLGKEDSPTETWEERKARIEDFKLALQDSTLGGWIDVLYRYAQEELEALNEWPTKQRLRVEKAVRNLRLLLARHDVCGITVLTGDHHSEVFPTGPEYGLCMEQHADAMLALGINIVDPIEMYGHTSKPDDFHADASDRNKQVMVPWHCSLLRGVFVNHQLMKVRDQLVANQRDVVFHNHFLMGKAEPFLTVPPASAQLIHKPIEDPNPPQAREAEEEIVLSGPLLGEMEEPSMMQVPEVPNAQEEISDLDFARLDTRPGAGCVVEGAESALLNVITEDIIKATFEAVKDATEEELKQAAVEAQVVNLDDFVEAEELPAEAKGRETYVAQPGRIEGAASSADVRPPAGPTAAMEESEDEVVIMDAPLTSEATIQKPFTPAAKPKPPALPRWMTADQLPPLPDDYRWLTPGARVALSKKISFLTRGFAEIRAPHLHVKAAEDHSLRWDEFFEKLSQMWRGLRVENVVDALLHNDKLRFEIKVNFGLNKLVVFHAIRAIQGHNATLLSDETDLNDTHAAVYHLAESWFPTLKDRPPVGTEGIKSEMWTEMKDFLAGREPGPIYEEHVLRRWQSKSPMPGCYIDFLCSEAEDLSFDEYKHICNNMHSPFQIAEDENITVNGEAINADDVTFHTEAKTDVTYRSKLEHYVIQEFVDFPTLRCGSCNRDFVDGMINCPWCSVRISAESDMAHVTETKRARDEASRRGTGIDLLAIAPRKGLAMNRHRVRQGRDDDDISLPAAVRGKCLAMKKSLAKRGGGDHLLELLDEPLDAYNYVSKGIDIGSLAQLELFTRLHNPAPGGDARGRKEFAGSHNADARLSIAWMPGDTEIVLNRAFFIAFSSRLYILDEAAMLIYATQQTYFGQRFPFSILGFDGEIYTPEPASVTELAAQLAEFFKVQLGFAGTYDDPAPTEVTMSGNLRIPEGFASMGQTQLNEVLRDTRFYDRRLARTAYDPEWVRASRARSAGYMRAPPPPGRDGPRASSSRRYGRASASPARQHSEGANDPTRDRTRSSSAYGANRGRSPRRTGSYVEPTSKATPPRLRSATPRPPAARRQSSQQDQPAASRRRVEPTNPTETEGEWLRARRERVNQMIETRLDELTQLLERPLGITFPYDVDGEEINGREPRHPRFNRLEAYYWAMLYARDQHYIQEEEVVNCIPSFGQLNRVVVYDYENVIWYLNGWEHKVTDPFTGETTRRY